MAKKGKLRSAKKFLKNLEPAGMVFTGIVRPAIDDENAVLFARPGDTKWIKIHEDQIQEMKLVQAAHRGKQSYPLVNLVLKQPQSAEGRVFAGLAQIHSPTASSPGATDLCWDSGKQAWVPCPKRS
jgi:hypothetical protein